LIGLALSTNAFSAVAAYCAFMAAQYGSEPGTFDFLMDNVAPSERNSASALHFLVAFTGQAVAASVGGVLLSRFGYPPVLTVAAIICILAALLFRLLLVHPAADPSAAQ